MQHLKAGKRFSVLLIRYRHIVDCENDVRWLDDAGGFDDAANRRDCGCEVLKDGLRRRSLDSGGFMLANKKAGAFHGH